MAIADRAPKKVLFAHTPKAAGSFMIEYFRRQLCYPVLQSKAKFPRGVWRDFTLGELRQHLGAAEGFLCSHTLAFGWSALVESIPAASKGEIVETIGDFRKRGWFTFTFVRHPGELLTSFYHYILDAHRRGWHDAVALHAPAVGLSLDVFIAAHCDKTVGQCIKAGRG